MVFFIGLEGGGGVLGLISLPYNWPGGPLLRERHPVVPPQGEVWCLKKVCDFGDQITIEPQERFVEGYFIS